MRERIYLSCFRNAIMEPGHTPKRHVVVLKPLTLWRSIMKKKNIFTLFILLSLLVSQFAVSTVALASGCDAAQFVADISVPDGSAYKAGDTFDKTWRLKNVGTCTWSTSYTLVFDSGNQMSAPASTAFSKSVAPGGTIDLTVKMTAPTTNGLIRGYWKLKNASSASFGIGANADKAFWVEIRVASADTGGGTGYDFVQKAGDATWTSGAGTLPFPGKSTDLNGAGLTVDNPKLEDGSAAGTSGLLMVPQSTYDGFVQGQYPAYHVQNGDRFKSIINCAYTATSCYVNFRLDYQIGSNPVRTFWSFNERYEGLYYKADLDLSALAGNDVKFILRVGAAGYATGDQALWGAPRIASTGTGPIATNTPTPTGTPPTPTVTNTPGPVSSCDRVTFVSDLDVPDGKVFGPGVSFTKTWRVKNTGTCTWTTSYKLVFVSGEQMGAAATEFNLKSTIAPNTTVDISVALKSPTASGNYRGYWQFKNAQGASFGLGSSNQPFWVEINVNGGIVVTPTGATATPTPTPVAAGPDRVTYIADISIPDGTVLKASQSFKKTWRIKNTGTSTWGTGYKIVFVSGDLMSGPKEAPLASTVAPNTTIDVSLDLISPANNGSYRGYWELKNADGRLFGLGTNADKPFWVDIVVKGASPSSGPTMTPTTGPSPTPTSTPQALTYTNQKYKFQFTYPAKGQIGNDQTDTSARITLPIAPNTNLGEKYVAVSVVENLSPCKTGLFQPTASENVTISGISFLKETGSEGAAGNIYESVAYSAVKGTACITMNFVLHSTNPGNYSTPPAVFDEAAESAVFSDIMTSFKWLN